MLVSTATLTGNTITLNTADQGNSGLRISGYIYSEINNNVTLINNLIADNHTVSDQQNPCGLDIRNSSVRLLHNTIARNTGSGIHVSDSAGPSTVALTNTILASHTVGIYVTNGNTVTLDATLWGTGTWANTTDWAGAGNITTGTVNVWGDPAFVDSEAGNYHITSDSAAIDAGVNAGITTDIDGESRPAGHSYDVGADELYSPTLKVIKRAYPNPVQAGERLTYTIRVTNTGNVTPTAIITDFLPAHITPGETPSGTLILPNATLTWQPVTILPDDVWVETVFVTVEAGYDGPLTNVVRVTTEQSVTGAYTETSLVQVTPALAVTKQASAATVQAGERLTYTIRVTNTGDITLTATITDFLPVHITPSETPSGTLILPSGTITWIPVIIPLDDVWMETVVVTVEVGYDGPLVNLVQVTTEEGAMGNYTEISHVGAYHIYLPLVLRQYP